MCDGNKDIGLIKYNLSDSSQDMNPFSFEDKVDKYSYDSLKLIDSFENENIISNEFSKLSLKNNNNVKIDDVNTDVDVINNKLKQINNNKHLNKKIVDKFISNKDIITKKYMISKIESDVIKYGKNNFNKVIDEFRSDKET